MGDADLKTAVSEPTDFQFGEASSFTTLRTLGSAAPSLGPLAAFTGTFTGSGFNTIFRPDSGATPTVLPTAVSGSDNVLELNLTRETLSFSESLGSVPNRGFVQGDIFLNGISYLQTISDVTVPSQPVGIHFEPGLWMVVPSTSDPAEGATVVRMASIPHGTTVQAQGTSSVLAGKPTIPAVSITPFIADGTITQEMLNDPNSLLRSHIASRTITSTTAISISTAPGGRLFGGGTDNIAFLLGDAKATGPNAQALKMEATFWIETAEFIIDVPVFEPGQPPLTIPAQAGAAGQPVPEFLVNPPVPITAPRSVTVKATQIQYSQQVFLNFNGLTWPHVSVATLVPGSPVAIPASVWT